MEIQKNVILLVLALMLSFCSTLKTLKSNLRKLEVKNTNLLEGPTTVQQFYKPSRDDNSYPSSSSYNSSPDKVDMSKKQDCVKNITRTKAGNKNHQRLCSSLDQ
jgi:hypothetical protein